ncbi:hypothetical protein RhiirC2_790272 [Rhizophagus irregularis]|uniref:Uncharacterized protein n=2 Tax=Rhizophagus irregularis TaxID=588596 RepID=A0A2N1MLK0_9GLOM|nr:hypothetical protein RhiirC2_790272 [Rhizophagus irregularis]
MTLSLETSVLLKRFGSRETYGKYGLPRMIEGPRWNLDEEVEVWARTGPIKVILKSLDNSHNISQEFIDQVSKHVD